MGIKTCAFNASMQEITEKCDTYRNQKFQKDPGSKTSHGQSDNRNFVIL